jgi:phosphoribosyl 1,2-cyclic phosphodiesterase
MRFSVLGSGSGGNAVLVEGSGTRILVDAGFSSRDLAERLRSREVDPESIAGIVVTHDHGDHSRGIGVFARNFGATIYLTRAAQKECARLLRGTERVVVYRPGQPFDIGSLRIEPFLSVHDAVDPVGVAVVEIGSGLRLGIATDLGRPTAHVRHGLSSADFLILEANHDEAMLHGASYPLSVKSRIGGSHGHLSNRAAARLATELFHPGLSGVVLAHLSAECNRPELAKSVVGGALKKAGFRGLLEVAPQDEPTEFFDLVALRRSSAPPQLSLF